MDETSSDSENENLSSTSSSFRFQPWMLDALSSSILEENSGSLSSRLEKYSELDRKAGSELPKYKLERDFSGNFRDVISFSRNAPLGPPPLCSICQHKSPTFGKPPRWFTYAELELVTGGFSSANFLAEGGYGSVHRGVLPHRQAVAIKQYKLVSSQGDQEFSSEVEVLRSAQECCDADWILY